MERTSSSCYFADVIRITGYPTEKNPDLLARIISASSNEGSLVLDCFAGSGTTLDIAGKMGRSWIGIDCEVEAIQTICKRLDLGSEKMGDFVSNQKQCLSAQQSLFQDLPRIFSFSCDPDYLEKLKARYNIDGADRFSYLSRPIVSQAQSKQPNRSIER